MSAQAPADLVAVQLSQKIGELSQQLAVYEVALRQAREDANTAQQQISALRAQLDQQAVHIQDMKIKEPVDVVNGEVVPTEHINSFNNGD